MKTLAGVICGALFAVLFSTAAMAACPVTYTFSNGTTADATQVNQNFSDLTGCVAPLASPSFTGNVGIGTASPNAKLEINSGTAPEVLRLNAPGTDPVLERFTDNSGTSNYFNYIGAGQLQSGDVGLIFQTGFSSASTKMVISTYGNVGIGTASPNAQLEINSGTAPEVLRLNAAGTDPVLERFVDNNGTSNYFNYIGAGVLQSGDVGLIFQTGISSASTKMVISTYGNVGIGTLTPGYTLHVNGSVAGTSAYNNLSDRRLKKNIAPIQDALSVVSRLQGIRFQWRSPAERSIGKEFNLAVNDPQVGFIAQDVRKVLPEAVSVAKDKYSTMSVAESKVVPVLVEAVKALKSANEKQAVALKVQADETARLKAELTSLERKISVRTASRSEP